MENIKLFFYETDPKGDTKRRFMFGLVGVIYFIIGVINPSKVSVSMLILGGIALIFYALFYKKIVKRCYISLDEEGIKSSNRTLFFPFKHDNLDVKWNEIKSITKETLKLQLNLNDESTKELQLGDLLYGQHQQLKSTLEKYALAKKISFV